MPEIIKIEKKCEGYTCDRCGEVVSRNEPDGGGGIKWWGVRAALENKQDEEICVKFDQSGLSQMSLQKIGRPDEKAKWVLCHSCANKLRDMLNEWMSPETEVKVPPVVHYDGVAYNVAEIDLRGKDVRLLESKCEYCNARLTGEAAIPQVDPYASEIDDDDTLHVLCETCVDAACDEI